MTMYIIVNVNWHFTFVNVNHNVMPSKQLQRMSFSTSAMRICFYSYDNGIWLYIYKISFNNCNNDLRYVSTNEIYKYLKKKQDEQAMRKYKKINRQLRLSSKNGVSLQNLQYYNLQSQDKSPIRIKEMNLS